METILVALLSASMFFDSVKEVDGQHIRVGFRQHEIESKMVICESQNLTSFRFWYDREDYPYAATRFKCSPDYG